MNPWIGWALAVAALAIGWQRYGGAGLALAASIIVFWLLLQLSRSLRVLRGAAQSPVGRVANAAALDAALRRGWTMLKVVALTGSLGRRVAEDPETWAWADASGAEVRIVFARGRCREWALRRSAD